MRFGGEIRRVSIEAWGAGGGNNAGVRGNFFFNGTQGPWSSLLSVPGYDTNIAALADFLAGNVYQSTILSGDVRRHVNQNIFDLFAQDSWRVTREVNINLGLRWDFQGPMHTGQQDLSTFDPSKGGLVVVGQQIDDLYPRSWKNFSPRLGFTYQPNGRDDFVVRGGLGLYYDTPATSPFLDQASLANNGAIGVEANPAGSKPVYQITRNAYTIVPNQSIFPANISISGNNVINLFSVSPDFQPAYVTSYNVNVEKSLGRNAIVQIGYVGSQGRHLNIVRDINQAALGSGFVKGTNAAGFTFQQQSRPYFSQFPNFGVIDQLESVGISSYNSLQASLRTRNWHGVISQFSYTLAYNRDDGLECHVAAAGQQQPDGRLRRRRLRHPAPRRRLPDLRHPRVLARSGVALSRLAVERQPLHSHRFPVHRPRLLGHERHRRKHDPRRPGGRSVPGRFANGRPRPARHVDQSHGLRQSTKRQLRYGGS